jgi:HK97 gp10 family phage protein
MDIENFTARLGLLHGKIAAHAPMGAAKAIQTEAKSAIGTYKYGWPKLSPRTVVRKRTGDRPLLETGKLRNSIKIKPGHSMATVYSDDPKAGYHEKGTSKMPPRPFMGPAIHHAKEAAQKALLDEVQGIFRSSLK